MPLYGIWIIPPPPPALCKSLGGGAGSGFPETGKFEFLLLLFAFENSDIFDTILILKKKGLSKDWGHPPHSIFN